MTAYAWILLWQHIRNHCIVFTVIQTIDIRMHAGKWPDHPHAYAKAKAAMGCQLADELASGFGLHARASEHCINALADGFAFRIFLASERYTTCTSSLPRLWHKVLAQKSSPAIGNLEGSAPYSWQVLCSVKLYEPQDIAQSDNAVVS